MLKLGLWLMFVVGAAACSETEDPPPPKTDCNVHADCAEGHVCLYGSCAKTGDPAVPDQNTMDAGGIPLVLDAGGSSVPSTLTDGGQPPPVPLVVTDAGNGFAPVDPLPDSGSGIVPTVPAETFDGGADTAAAGLFDAGSDYEPVVPVPAPGTGTDGGVDTNDGDALVSPQSQYFSVYGDSASPLICAISESSKLNCWRPNSTAAMGEDIEGLDIVSTGAVYEWVSVGKNLIYAVTNSGHLARWDHQGDTQNILSADADDWSMVNASSDEDDQLEACGINAGTLECWDESNISMATPSLSDWVTVEPGNPELCGIYGDGNIHCWYWHQSFSAHIPTISDVHSVALSDIGCVIYGAGGLYCWDVMQAEGLEVPPLSEWISIAVGSGTKTCGVTADHSLYCWELIGQDLSTEVPVPGVMYYIIEGGNETVLTDVDVTVGLGSGTAPRYMQVEMDDNWVCASTMNGTLRCWEWLYSDAPTNADPFLMRVLVPPSLVVKN
ncbi:MAG: hypothetical protein CMH56_10500 [Myxococcales bacterium]|nr:hypothetical protein [Myxococcales bacterium]